MRVLSAVVAGVFVLSFAGCTPNFAKNGQADVLLVVESIVGNAGAGPNKGQDSAFLLSDVQTKGGVINDSCKVKVSVLSKDPLVSKTGAFDDVLLDRYDIVYTRSDGHNAQGVDVPYAFSGPLALQVAPGSDGTVAFVCVRHEAKLEPPLRNMVNGGGLDILQTIATITIQGTTTAGKVVQASGRLEVTFADFADEQ